MRAIVIDFERGRSVCLCVRWSRSLALHTAEAIEMPFGELTHVGLRNHAVDRGQGQTNPFAAGRGDKTAMQLFVKIL